MIHRTTVRHLVDGWLGQQELEEREKIKRNKRDRVGSEHCLPILENFNTESERESRTNEARRLACDFVRCGKRRNRDVADQ